MSLREYRKKRNFSKTTEPVATKSSPSGRRFVIQKHAASRLHFDLRLELGGALKSWAVPKGLPLRHGEKHLAVEVEDHPLSYREFEGTIPEGEYGGGTVMVWDFGNYRPLTRTPARDLAAGKLHFVLEGKKLQGEWYLVGLREGKDWLVIRGGDDHPPVPAGYEKTSTLSGRTMAAIAKGKAPRENPPTSKTATLPEFVEPMMAKLVNTPPDGRWSYEIKFDGWRAIVLKSGTNVQLLSRTRHDLGETFPDLVAAFSRWKLGTAVVDGEIVVLDSSGRPSFQRLQSWESEKQKPPLLFYAFDLLHLDGEDLTSRPLLERKALLESRLASTSDGPLRYAAPLGSNAGALLSHVEKIGLEGLIGKRIDSPYEPGRRSGAWIKLKLHHAQEFVIGGYTEPVGSRPHFGALVVGYYDGKKLLCAGKVGTGFHARSLRAVHAEMTARRAKTCPFHDLPDARAGRWGQGITSVEMKRCHWLRPELVCQVRFAEWTRDGRLRQPVFLGLRHDKPARAVVRES